MPGNKINPRGFVVDRRNNLVVGEQVLALLCCFVVNNCCGY